MEKIRRMIIGIFAVTLIGFGLFIGKNYFMEDKTAPQIIFDADFISASIEDTDSALIDGVTAVDDKDGDVSSSLMIESINKLDDDRCIVNYAAFDQANNVAKASRELEFTDYRPIHFNIDYPLRFVLGATGDIAQAITADDCIDGDITNKIKVISNNGDSQYNGEGIYNYNVEVSNSIGDTAVLPVSVEFYVDSYEVRMYYPVIYLSSYVVYVKQGSRFEPNDYLEAIGVGNELHIFEEIIGNGRTATEIAEQIGSGKRVSTPVNYSIVRCQSNVNTREKGIYTAEYSCTTNDNYMGTTQLIVVVE